MIKIYTNEVKMNDCIFLSEFESRENSRAYNYFKFVELIIDSYLKAKKAKKPNFKLGVVCNETVDKTTVEKIIICSDDLTENDMEKFKIQFQKKPILISKENNVIEYKEKIQKFIDNFSLYLKNNTKFKGVIKAKTLNSSEGLEYINITPTGKGVNDEIVFIAKTITSELNASSSIILNMDDDEQYEFINNHFES